MAKDPAFLMYPGDWNMGTLHMTILEKGCYMELLMLQFAMGKFTEANAKHMLNGSFDLAWATVSRKFCTDGTFFWNKRLMAEMEKRSKFTESRRVNALKVKKDKEPDEHMQEHMHKHMENENENNNVLNKFNTNPVFSDFNGLPEIKIGAAIEFVKIIKQTDLTALQVKGIWDVFKIQNLNGKKYYRDEDAVYSHFLNWIKTQNFTNGAVKQFNGNAGKSAGAEQLLAKIKSNYSARGTPGD